MREAIIAEMCLTMRHDFGLEKHPEDILSSGMTPEDRQSLINSMSQIYDNAIQPIITKIVNERCDRCYYKDYHAISK